MNTILVPLDGSTLAERAVPFAARIAAGTGWSIRLLRAVDTLRTPTEAAGKALVREAQAAIDAVAQPLTADGLTVTTRVVDAQAETAILAATADENVALVVMSTHGRGGLGRFIYGSVTDTVLRHAAVPVLAVPPHGLDAWSPEAQVKILVPLDGSDLSRAALKPACQLADLLGGTLLLASVVAFPAHAAYAGGYTFAAPVTNDNTLMQARHYLEEIADGLRTSTRPVEVCATYGSPFYGVTNIARACEVGLIVMATHGRGGVTRALLGSVATATIRQADVPIMLVRFAEVEPITAGASEMLAAEEQPVPVAEQVRTEPSVTLSLTPHELDAVTNAVATLFYDEPVDPRSAEPIRLVLEKLRAARAEASTQPPSQPAISAR